MSKNIVADFNAFLSVSVDDSPLFETKEGRIIVTHEEVVISNGEDKHTLPIATLVNFDFRTVPEQWEQFFDDLVGVKFAANGQATTVTIGTETEIADRFVTVLLKLLLEDTRVAIKQQLSSTQGDDQHQSGTSTISLLPQSEYIRFDDAPLRPIDISTVVDVTPAEGGEGVVIDHTADVGTLRTVLKPETPRRAPLLKTYLDFRSELATDGAPIRFLYVGEDRDKMILIAKILDHRDIAYEVGFAPTCADAIETLDSADTAMECVVSEYELPNETGVYLHRTLREKGYDAPMVFMTSEDPDEVSMVDTEDIVDVIEIGLRTEHYEDVADAIEDAAELARSETGDTH